MHTARSSGVMAHMAAMNHAGPLPACENKIGSIAPRCDDAGPRSGAGGTCTSGKVSLARMNSSSAVRIFEESIPSLNIVE